MLTHCDELIDGGDPDADDWQCLRLELSAEEVIHRLSRALDRQNCPWLGYLCGRRFQLNAPDPWAPILQGEIVEAPDGSLVRTRFCGSRFHRQYRRVVLCALGGCGVIGLCLALGGLGSEVGASRASAVVAVGVVTAVCFLLFESCELLAHHLGRTARHELEAFTHTLLTPPSRPSRSTAGAREAPLS